MDLPNDNIVTTSHMAGSMNYPSTTQALFALIVMIIVLLFILVYCCWGTFSCANQDDRTNSEGARRRSGSLPQTGRTIVQGSHAVIVPINNMIYVGDPETQRIFQIPLGNDKPPAYTQMFTGSPPPPYLPDNSIPSLTNSDGDIIEIGTLTELPPPYDDCLSSSSDDESMDSEHGGIVHSETIDPENRTSPIPPNNDPTLPLATIPQPESPTPDVSTLPSSPTTVSVDTTTPVSPPPTFAVPSLPPSTIIVSLGTITPVNLPPPVSSSPVATSLTEPTSLETSTPTPPCTPSTPANPSTIAPSTNANPSTTTPSTPANSSTTTSSTPENPSTTTPSTPAECPEGCV